MRGRTTAAATVVVAITFAVAALLLVVGMRRSLLQRLDDIAEFHANDVATLASAGALPSSFARPSDDVAGVYVVDASGRVIASSGGPSPSARILALRPPAGAVLIRNLDGKRVLARRASTPNGPVTVTVTTTTELVDDSISRLRKDLAIGVPLLLFFVAGVTWVTVGRALRPVEAMRAEVDGISERSLDRRVAVPGADELKRLASTMNTMLDRIESSVDGQRRFVADASHELQTPLASFRADLEIARAHPEATDWSVTADDLLATSGKMEQLVKNLLYLARADATHPPATSLVDLDDLVLEEATAIRQRGRVPVDTTGVSAAAVEGRRDDLARVVRNLLENADQYATSLVTVTLSADIDAAVLTVRDDGPGIPPAERERVFERFTRLDGARDRASGGTGLGLAIAREVVVSHGGSVSIEDASPGARVVVRLPSA
jgi:signal transduction histidine kinase